MADGMLVKMLVFTQVHRYIELGQVEGSYVLVDGKLQKVPASDSEALSSPLLGFLEKRRCHKFFSYTADWNPAEPKSHKGHDLLTMTSAELFDKYSLSENTRNFIGHAIALFRDEEYLTQPAAQLVGRMQLYFQSILRYGKSPYIYPMYGLGELPQAFARLSAVYGGTYMLRKPFEGIEKNDAGEVVGVKSEGETAKCKFVVADPSYFPEKVTQNGEIARCICFLKASPIKNIGSAQIIVPAKQVGRQSDMYISFVSSTHNVVPQGMFLAIVNAKVETGDPMAELEPGLRALGGEANILEKFFKVSPVMVPNEDGAKDKIFISSTYDETSHFETTCLDILDMYKRITGNDLDLNVDLDALREMS